MFKSFIAFLCVLSLGVFTGCEVAEKQPSSSVVYFRTIVAKSEALDIAGYAPAKEGTNIACIKNGTQAKAKLKITAQGRSASATLWKNTKLIIKSVDAVYTQIDAPAQASHVLTTFDNVTIDFDQSTDVLVIVRNVNSEPASIPADAIYKYKLTFDVIGTERLLGQSDYTGVFTALWGDLYIVGKDVDCAEAIKK